MVLFKRIKKGFTLAEVLVTLGIIGVVSALTVPTLMQNNQRKVFVTQLHKVYSEIGQAVELYMSDNHLVSLREGRITGNQAELNTFVKKYFKVVKDCNGRYYNPNGNSCFAQYYTTLDGSTTIDETAWQCMVTVTLASGASLCLDTGAMEDTEAGADVNGDGVVDENDKAHSNMGAATDAVTLTVGVDVNGMAGPNIYGRDFFRMDVNNRGLVYDSTWTDDSELDTSAVSFGIGKIVEDGWQMTY